MGPLGIGAGRVGGAGACQEQEDEKTRSGEIRRREGCKGLGHKGRSWAVEGAGASENGVREVRLC